MPTLLRDNMTRYAIYDKNGNIDRDPEPMIFDDHQSATECLQFLQGEGQYDDTYYVGIYVEPPKKWTTDTKIIVNGTSLAVNVTAGCRLMELERGDIIRVTIERIDPE